MLTTATLSALMTICEVASFVNRPEAKNALNKELSLELARILGDLRGRDDIRVCILIGSGQCFCAGAGLHMLLGVAPTVLLAQFPHLQLLCP